MKAVQLFRNQFGMNLMSMLWLVTCSSPLMNLLFPVRGNFNYARSALNKRLSSTAKPSLPAQYTVDAYYIGKGIDLNTVRQQIYANYPYTEDTKSITITLCPNAGQYVSIFNYGSVVLYNLSDEKCSEHVETIRTRGTTTPFLMQKKDDFVVHEELRQKKDTLFHEEYEVCHIGGIGIQ